MSAPHVAQIPRGTPHKKFWGWIMEIARGKPRETWRNTKYLAICEQYGLMRGLPRGEGYRRLGCTEDADPNHYPYMLTKHKGTVKKMGITQLDAPRKPVFNALPHPSLTSNKKWKSIKKK